MSFNFKNLFIQHLYDHFADCLSTNNLLSLITELIENEQLVPHLLEDIVVQNFERIKNYYNFYTLVIAIFNKFMPKLIIRRILADPDLPMLF